MSINKRSSCCAECADKIKFAPVQRRDSFGGLKPTINKIAQGASDGARHRELIETNLSKNANLTPCPALPVRLQYRRPRPAPTCPISLPPQPYPSGIELLVVVKVGRSVLARATGN